MCKTYWLCRVFQRSICVNLIRIHVRSTGERLCDVLLAAAKATRQKALNEAVDEEVNSPALPCPALP